MEIVNTEGKVHFVDNQGVMWEEKPALGLRSIGTHGTDGPGPCPQGVREIKATPSMEIIDSQGKVWKDDPDLGLVPIRKIDKQETDG